MRAHGWAFDHIEANSSNIGADKLVSRRWCLMGVHDCWNDDSARMDDPAHLIAQYGCN